MRSRYALALATLLASGLPLGASALLIDDFVDAQSVSIPVGPPNPQTVSNGLAGTSTAGGARVLQLDRTAGFGSASLDADLSESDVLSFSTAAAVVSRATLTYDGNTNSTLDPSALSLDVTDGGTSTLLRLVVRSDLAATVAVNFHDGTTLSYAEIAVPGTGTGGPFQVIDVPLASLLAGPGGAANLTDVGAISVAIFGPASLDLQIDSIATIVPEPGPLALIGLGVGALLAVRRRRRARP